MAAMERRALPGSLDVDIDLDKFRAIVDWYQRDAENAKPLGDQ